MNRNMRYRPSSGSGSLETYRNLDQKSLQQRGVILEQKMLSNNKPFNRKRQYSTEQSSQNYVPYETNQGGIQNFAYLYDDAPGPSYNHGHVPNKKRPKINVWDIDVFGTNQNPSNQRNIPYTTRQSPPKPLMSLPTPPIKRRRLPNVPPKVNKNFPPKVSKPFIPKTKPIDQSIKIPVQPADKEQFILRADKVPCQQMVGRLELALGSILKEMKATLCTSTETFSLFTSKVIQRSIKQTIRERIKSVMLNKHIGKYVDIIETYRKRFPQNTDKDILDMAAIKTGTSEQHIKQSFDKILIRKINTMFRKLQVLVEEKETEVAKLIEARQLFKDDKKTNEDIQQSVKIESDFYLSVVDSLLGARLPKVLPNYASCIVKMLKREGLLNQTNGADANIDDSGPIELPDSDEDDVIEVKSDAGKEVNTESVAKIEINESIQDEEMTKDVSDVQNKAKEDDIIEKVTVKVEPGTNNKAIENNEKQTQEKEGQDNSELEKKSEETIKPASQLYLAKVLCQPDLPSKAEAYKFLNKFNMVSVKKHKVLQNLLVVGFKNEKDYNNILAASGTVIENSTLTIKGSKPQQATTPSISNSEEEIKREVCSKDSQLLTPDLENQITDLLSSIRAQNDESSSNNTTAEETDLTNEGEKPEEKTNLYSPSRAYEEEKELDTIKEVDESKEGEQETATEETTEVKKSIDPDVDKSTADVNETTTENIDETNAENGDTKPEDVDKTPIDVGKTLTDVDKTSTDVGKTSTDVDKTSTDVGKTSTDVDKTSTEVGKTSTDIDKISTDVGKTSTDVDKTSTDVDETSTEDIDKMPEENVDTAERINKEGKRCSTPVRSSSRLAATPSSVRTRRSSKLLQNN